MLQVKEITKSYGSKQVLKGVNLELEREEVRAFLGPNGAGKTTTFNVIAGVEPPTGGSVYLDGEDAGRTPIHVRARKGLSYLPQETSLFRGLLVKENVLVYLQRQGVKRKDREKSVDRSLEQLNILELKDRKCVNLSAGQKRKVEIARSLSLSPNYFLLDEPFSDLDPRSVEDLRKILISLKQDEGIGIALSDHRAREAISIADYNYLIGDGRIIAEGSSEEILDSETAREAYLGEGFDLPGLAR